MKKVIRFNESELHNIIFESVNRVLKELDTTTYQNASELAFDNDDDRVYSFRKQAEKEYVNNPNDNFIRANGVNNDVIKRCELNTSKFLELNNGKKLIIFDDEYKDLNSLYNGVKRGKLLIHARGLVGEVSDDMRYIYPSFDETLLDAYGYEYDSVYDAKKEYYGDDFDEDGYMRYPKLIFASDDFSWVSSERNGVFFIESDGFQKSLGDGKIQLPNGRICKYYEGDVYDYDCELFQDEPICCEYGDWYSRDVARVVGILLY